MRRKTKGTARCQGRVSPARASGRWRVPDGRRGYPEEAAQRTRFVTPKMGTLSGDRGSWRGVAGWGTDFIREGRNRRIHIGIDVELGARMFLKKPTEPKNKLHSDSFPSFLRHTTQPLVSWPLLGPREGLRATGKTRKTGEGVNVQGATRPTIGAGELMLRTVGGGGGR